MGKQGFVTGHSHRDGVAKRNSKCVRAQGDKVAMVVGKDVAISDIQNFASKTLVDRFCSKEVGEATLSRWMELHWYPVLSYRHVFHILVRGWLCFVFQIEEDCEKILGRGWNWGSSGLVIHKWSVEFDLARAPVDIS